MHDDLTRPKSSMGVVVNLKCKTAASSASSGGNSKTIVSFELCESSNKSPELLLEGLATSEHMPALLRRHIGFVRDYSYYNTRSSRESIVLRHYVSGLVPLYGPKLK